MAVCVIGAGAWGTTVASILTHHSDVKIWARRPDLAAAISDGTNPAYLKGFPLPRMTGTSVLEEAVKGAEAVFLAVPSHGFRDVLTHLASHIAADLPLISLSKGIEGTSRMRMTEVISDVLPDHDPRVVGVISGPNLADVEHAAAAIEQIAYQCPIELRRLWGE